MGGTTRLPEGAEPLRVLFPGDGGAGEAGRGSAARNRDRRGGGNGDCKEEGGRRTRKPSPPTSPQREKMKKKRRRSLILLCAFGVAAIGSGPYVSMWSSVFRSIARFHRADAAGRANSLLASAYYSYSYNNNRQQQQQQNDAEAGGAATTTRRRGVREHFRIVGNSSTPLRTLHSDTGDGSDGSDATFQSSCPVAATADAVATPTTTLAVQTSLNRAWILQETCKRWRTDPIIAVVSVTRQEQRQQKARLEKIYGAGGSPSGDTNGDGRDRQVLLGSRHLDCPQLTIIEYWLDDSQSEPEMFPVNSLRNVALSHVETSHVLVVDVDFVPSTDLDVTIRDVLAERQRQEQQQKEETSSASRSREEAFVVPAFDRLVHKPCKRNQVNKDCINRCFSDDECNRLKKDGSFIPRNVEELAECHKSNRCVSFQSDIKPSGHSTTRPAMWLKEQMQLKTKKGGGAVSAATKTRTIPCFHSDEYEPYVVIRFCGTGGGETSGGATSGNSIASAANQTMEPPQPQPAAAAAASSVVAPYYDERFHGYGKNKIQYTSHLRYMGYKFSVLPRGFLVHNPHRTSETKVAWRNDDAQLRERMNKLYPQFLNELAITYSDRRRQMTPICVFRKKQQEEQEKKKEMAAKHVPTQQKQVSAQRCAINFYGVPRSFESMVLPSIVRNVIESNAKYNCDYFVHCYSDADDEEEDPAIAAEKENEEAAHPTEAILLQEQIDLVAKKLKLSRVPSVAYVQEREQDVMKKYESLIHDMLAEISFFFPWTGRDTVTQIRLVQDLVKRWHSMEVSWKIMEQSSKADGKQYERVAVLPSDVVYATTIDIFRDSLGPVDPKSQVAVVPAFANFPAYDYMIYGPSQIVKVWATKRFELLNKYGLWMRTSKRALGLHPENFFKHALLPAMKGEGGADTGIDHLEKWCSFFHDEREPDKSVWVNNCEQDGTSKRTITDRGIDVEDPELYTTVDLKGDSSTATVIGMGTGYPLETHQRFVGSLRKSGFKGNILLLVESNVSTEITRYFRYRNVTYKEVEMINSTMCTQQKNYKFGEIKVESCLKDYPSLKARWGRYPLLKDFLQECKTCTGPVFYIDERDSFFQRDPFGEGSLPVSGLQVYQENKNHTTAHWFVAKPMLQCKNVRYDEPNLCSGSTVGTRAAMLRYLGIMYEEIKDWVRNPKCTFSDQSLHNYLFYSGQLPFATSVENQAGGMVNTVFYAARQINEQHAARMAELHPEAEIPDGPKEERNGKAQKFPFEGADGMRWVGAKDLIDDEGFFIEADGSRSRAVHKYDRFGGVDSHFYNTWLSKQDWLKDPIPENFV